MRRALSILLCVCAMLPCAALAAEQTTETTCAAWLPYWEVNASVEEAVECAGHFSELIAFAAIFDAEDHLLLPDGLSELLEKLRSRFGGTVPIYLSVVNDVEVAEDTYENKTVEPLRRLFASDEAMTAHIDELIALCVETGVDGLEIDYEALRSEAALWDAYSLFIERLYARAQEAGLALRAVLNWDAARYAALPAGPEYSIMCYNLYGYHSGPGPKADAEFLRQTYQLNLGLPGVTRMAYATGGFDWWDESIRALTQIEAEMLAVQYAATPTRDEDSGAVRFFYDDIDGVTHEVWYADAETLGVWRAQAMALGYSDFDLFRLGGNNVEDMLTFLP